VSDLRERLRRYVQAASGFSGWTFDYEPRRLGPPKPWSYSGRARELLQNAATVLDLGTAAGERFGSLIEGYGGRAVATEEWVVNAPLAATRLRPLGADILRASSTVLPFAAGSFGLVLSRHEAIDPFEVARVLAPGGSVLTQQVDDLWWAEMRDFFPRWQNFGDHYHCYAAGFVAAGLTLVRNQRHLESASYRFEEAIKHLCLMPWYVADFDPLDSDYAAIEALEKAATAEGELVLTEAQYMLEARKPM
jgi:SAM-dependent methyltransferase